MNLNARTILGILGALPLLLLSPVPAPAAWAAVGTQHFVATGAPCNNVDFCEGTFPGSVTSGNFIACGGRVWASGAAPSGVTVTDTGSTSYSVLLGAVQTSTNYRPFIATGIASASGAHTVRADPAGNPVYLSFACKEFSGSHATPLDVDGNETEGNDTAPQDGLTTGVDNALLIGVGGRDGGGSRTFTPDAGYTSFGNQDDQATNVAFNIVYRIISGAAGAFTVSWTLDASAPWQVSTASFKPAVATAGCKGLALRGAGC